MQNILIDDFQNTVGESLIRHKSVIDIMTKLSESNSRINRALAKSVTNCGCIKILAEKQKVPNDISLEEVSEHLSYQIGGKICDNCREVLEKEIGMNLYYLAALCDALDISMFDVLLQEDERIKTLGKFSMR